MCYICGIFTKSLCSWAKRMKKNVFQSCLVVDSGIRRHMYSCVRVMHNAFFSLGCAGFLFSEPTVFCLLCEVSKKATVLQTLHFKTCFHSWGGRGSRRFEITTRCACVCPVSTFGHFWRNVIWKLSSGGHHNALPLIFCMRVIAEWRMRAG